jgi:hypothetical protein
MDYSFFVLIISIFAARFIQINAFKNLTDEDKPKVMSKNIMQLSQASLVFTIILIVAFYFLINKYPEKYTSITSSFFIVLVLQRIIVYVLARKKMIDNGVPASYLTKYFFSWLVTTIGVASFIVLFMWQFNHGTS